MRSRSSQHDPHERPQSAYAVDTGARPRRAAIELLNQGEWLAAAAMIEAMLFGYSVRSRLSKLEIFQ